MFEGNLKQQEKYLVSREEKVLVPSRIRTRPVAAETVGQREKVEHEKSDLITNQRLSVDGMTDAILHNANSKPQALEVGGDCNSAKDRRPLKHLTCASWGTKARPSW